MTEQHDDVIVIGGGSAGVAAAVGASRSGARTLLVEHYGFLGGAATTSNVLAYCGFWTSAEKPIMGVQASAPAYSTRWRHREPMPRRSAIAPATGSS